MPTISPLEVRNENGPLWVLISPLSFRNITVPSGFKTDFASIPPLSTIAGCVLIVALFLAHWFFFSWFIVSFALLVILISHGLMCDNLIDAPATVHDWEYATQTLSRAESDAILFDALIANGVSTWKAVVIWLNVRLFGWLAWKQDQKKYGLKA